MDDYLEAMDWAAKQVKQTTTWPNPYSADGLRLNSIITSYFVNLLRFADACGYDVMDMPVSRPQTDMTLRAKMVKHKAVVAFIHQYTDRINEARKRTGKMGDGLDSARLAFPFAAIYHDAKRTLNNLRSPQPC
jgi:hypothetical protein